MFLELIAVFVAGFVGAGLMMVLNKLTGGRLPRWLIPVAAGAAMLAAAISSEYGWYGRNVTALPDGMSVAETGESKALWRPWTYVYPIKDRFVAVDLKTLRQNDLEAHLWLTELYFFGRWQPTQTVEVIVDCKDFRRADPVLGDGSPPLWRDVGGNDPIVKTVCKEV